MDARELRIGNWVQILGVQTQIEGFCTWDNLVQSSSFAERDIGGFGPIPLNEEWTDRIEGLIFEKHLYVLRLPTDSEIWFWDGVVYVANYDCPNTNYATKTPVKHVHQLQNLYFALTGEELQFKTVG